MENYIRVWREDNYYIAEIPSLHIVDQGQSLKELKANLKEAIELTVESLVKDDLKLKGKRAKEAISLLESPLVASLGMIQQKGKKAVLNSAMA